MIRWQSRTTTPMQAGNFTLRLQARALQVRWPGGGFVWNRPVAVLVESEAGKQARLPIVDVTRLMQLGLVALVLGVGLVDMWGRPRRRDAQGEKRT